MKIFFAILLAFTPAPRLSAANLDPATASRISSAKQQIAAHPRQADPYTALALAFIKAARSTDDSSYLRQARQAVADALRLAPGDFEAGKAEVALHLAECRYTDALEKARVLNRKVPDDNLLYGFIADARIALGDYAAAEKSAQWMIDQRPVNAAGLQRGARLREIFGYNDPALEWWNSSLRMSSASDPEERAWILVNMSRVDRRSGKPAAAEQHARQALDLVPGYPWADDALAAALMDQGKPADAAGVLEKRLSAAPRPAARFHLVEALEQVGSSEAPAQGQRFEHEAAALVSLPDNANRELIEYYASHGRGQDAVKLAAAESQRRTDIRTLAVYALALRAAGQYEQARVQMDRALAPGIRDPRLFYRAGMIAAQLNDPASARKYLKKVIEINANSPEAENAIRLLANLSPS